MTLAQSILATLIYHDIFDYPLTDREIHHYLIGTRSNFSKVKSALSMLTNKRQVARSSDFYALPKRNRLFKLRKQRDRFSSVKLKRAKIYANILKVIPTVKLAAISGALAMQNSHKNDDIDLVLITSSGSIWTTRFLANLLLWPFKRDPAGQKISNRACLNLFLDEAHLTVKEQNLYTAHEIAQMKLIWNRENTYQRLIKTNSWIKKYLPNWQASSEFLDHGSEKKKLSTTNPVLQTTEKFFRNFQLNYMKSKITTEKIEEGQLFFHPADTQEKVLKTFARGSRTP